MCLFKFAFVHFVLVLLEKLSSSLLLALLCLLIQVAYCAFALAYSSLLLVPVSFLFKFLFMTAKTLWAKE